MNNKVSVIIPFVNEFPQIVFTIRSIYEAFHHKVDFEVIAINNYCDEVRRQGREEDKGYATLQASAKVNRDWLRVLHYDTKLSHWQAKNLGVRAADGNILWFCDAHCIAPGEDLANMARAFIEAPDRDSFTMHLPLTYQILESHRLIYKLIVKPFQCDYSFSAYNPASPNVVPMEVPVMSTCGMMMSMTLFENIGGFPELLGIYGGGEHFINFVLATLGVKKFIWPAKHALYHHGDRRGYSWNSADYLRNRAIATYLYADAGFLATWLSNCKGRIEVKQRIYREVLEQCSEQRSMLVKKRVCNIGEWVKEWAPDSSLMP